MKKLITLFALLLAVYSQCISPGNEAVDWFVMLKMPGGYNYIYGDISNPTLRTISNDLNDKNNPIARTIDGIYQRTTDNYLMYNDETPNGKISEKRGHTKGETALIYKSFLYQ